MRILVATNHLADFGGSELVALEVAETFHSMGHDVGLFANYIDDPLKSELAKTGLSFTDVASEVALFDYDIVWCQHNVVSYLLWEKKLPPDWSTRFVFVHLSPYEILETPGLVAEEVLADLIIVNSVETKQTLIDKMGVEEKKISIFYNAAPPLFIQKQGLPSALKRLLLISNHLPEEVKKACELANKHYGIEIKHIGLPGITERITVNHMQWADAVVTMAKTAQYAILSCRPLYCYDKFGGPGWLLPSHLSEAENYNFSGRCCYRKLTAEEICHEWITGYQNALKHVEMLQNICEKKYRLDYFIADLLQDLMKKEPPSHRGLFEKIDRARLEQYLERESRLFAIIRRHFVSQKVLEKHYALAKMTLQNRRADAAYARRTRGVIFTKMRRWRVMKLLYALCQSMNAFLKARFRV